MVFPTFFNLSLNLAIRSSWSEPQSAPGLVFADYSIFKSRDITLPTKVRLVKAMVFPMFFYLSLNFVIRWPGSEPQSAPGIVFTNCIEPLHLWLQKYNQSDFSVDHLVMSMCRVFSCVVGRGCLL